MRLRFAISGQPKDAEAADGRKIEQETKGDVSDTDNKTGVMHGK
jgi:hypothetical protein